MADLDAIRRALAIEDVAARLGIDVPRKGDAVCPRHNGASLRIKQDYFYCHGGCADEGGKGDIFNLVMFAQRCDFQAALEQCAAWAGVPLRTSPAERERIERRRVVEDVLGIAAEYYRGLFVGSDAEAYANERHINHPEAMLGYAPDRWDGLITAAAAIGVTVEHLHNAGLVVARSNGSGYYDLFRHRIVFPVYERGRCVYLQGRRLREGDNPKYLNVGVDRPPLYHVNGALSAVAPILTESTTDALQLHMHALPALGTFGAKLEPHHVTALQRYERVYVAVQNDATGGKLADAAALAFGERAVIVPPPAEHKGWDEALQAGVIWTPDDHRTWLRWRVHQIDPKQPAQDVKKALDPIFAYLATVTDEALIITYMDELRQRFGWKRDLHQAYLKHIRERRQAAQREQRPDTADVSAEGDELGETVPPPVFVNPAQAEHDGVVYCAQMMSFKATKTTKRGSITATVWRPIVVTSDRRRIIPVSPPEHAPDGAVTWLDESRNLALRGQLSTASENRWTYDGLVAFLNGSAEPLAPHVIYDRLMANLRQYIYHADEVSYSIDVLWAMGTYVHQLFDAFPYLALHGHRGAGKSTLLKWLEATSFNAQFLVNTSEAALYRSIQAFAPTMLIDEQEGLNSSKAAKENKADLMGLLKSGYKRGAGVARQRMDDPSITEWFDVYCPKALAAIEHFEDVLESRAIITMMSEKPAHVKLEDQAHITLNDRTIFAPLRDALYLMLMHESHNIRRIAQRVQFTAENRFRELFLPLFTMAALVDLSRGDGKRTVVDELQRAADVKLTLRQERDSLTPESQLVEALRIVIRRARYPEQQDYHPPMVQGDGTILCDTLHISDAMRQLFSDDRQSYYNDQWLGKQAMKTPGIERAQPERRWRPVEHYDPGLGQMVTTKKALRHYVLSPDHLDPS